MKPIRFYKTFFVLSFFALLIYSCNSNSTIATANTNHFDTHVLWRGWNQYQIPESDSMAKIWSPVNLQILLIIWDQKEMLHK